MFFISVPQELLDEIEEGELRDDIPVQNVPIPKEVEQIQSYLITLVAAIVKLEKRRRKRSYEDYVADDDDGNASLHH